MKEGEVFDIGSIKLAEKRCFAASFRAAEDVSKDRRKAPPPRGAGGELRSGT
ncbi:hypothetical protein SAMN02745121_07264 [Nannocystis exedens]|uniref:Uncharacterized protein n=1 Tax=Nannocystis exedens TaxID=54 RepID=A0A1I2GFI2_9BACT|nr:hypothetical protein [Nannocystis exedens]PCC69960.1 hypothetical protein NAEX_02988 [Nannocystis exedens]SFF16262.1 hypothetical protein SAMN02745121_07264 [Nannocystis exedens]